MREVNADYKHLQMEDDVWFETRGERDILPFLERARLAMACKIMSDDEIDGAELEKRKKKKSRRYMDMKRERTGWDRSRSSHCRRNR